MYIIHTVYHILYDVHDILKGYINASVKIYSRLDSMRLYSIVGRTHQRI